MTTAITKRIKDEELEKLKKELKSLKRRHEQLLKSYKELFKAKKELEDKVEFLKYVIKR